MPIIRTTPRTPAGEILTDLTMDIFRLNNLILTAGDHLVREIGLTSARWQILGAISRAEHPHTVAGLARNLGANRQNVQRIVNDLNEHGFIAYETNPHHRRAQLVVLTGHGRKSYASAMKVQAPWVNKVTDGLPLGDMEAFRRVLLSLRRKLEDRKADE